MPLTGYDWNSPYRMPQGWTTMPDGSVGPSSDLPDWLKQLVPSPGASVPNAPGGPGQGLMPGGGVMNYQGATPGGPSMGFPAQGGPQVMGPQNSPIPPHKQVGAWTNPFTDGKTIDPAEFGGSGGGLQSILSMFGGGNPYARAAIAAGGMLQPTPADTGELPLSRSGARPMHPSSTGAMPGPMPGADGVNPYAAAANARAPMPSRPYSPTPENYPSWPTVGAQGSSPGDIPRGTPSDTPRPSSPMPPKRPKNLGAAPPRAAASPSSSDNPLFGQVQYQVSGNRGPLSNNPIYSTLNLPELFKRMRSS